MGALVPIVVGTGLVGFRSHLHSEVTVLILALTVVFGAAAAGPLGGTVAAFSAAATFDFFFTVPYRSLKINDWTDVVATVLLLIVGVAVGLLRALADRRSDDAEAGRLVGGALSRVLGVAATSEIDDIESAVRAELFGVLGLQECWFRVEETPHLPVLNRHGHLDMTVLVERDGGYELPARGIQLPVQRGGHTFGYLVCVPEPVTGVSLERRRLAVAISAVLGLAWSGHATSDCTLDGDG